MIFEKLLNSVSTNRNHRKELIKRVSNIITENFDDEETNLGAKMLAVSLYSDGDGITSSEIKKCLIIACGGENVLSFSGTYSFLNYFLECKDINNNQIDLEDNSKLDNYKLITLAAHKLSFKKVLNKVACTFMFNATKGKQCFTNKILLKNRKNKFENNVDKTMPASEAANCESLNGNASGVTMRADIDAIVGCIPFTEASKTFTNLVNFSVEYNLNKTIVCKKEFLDTVKGICEIKNLKNIKLGKIRTSDGDLNLYYVFPSVDTDIKPALIFAYVREMFVFIKNELNLNELSILNFSNGFEFNLPREFQAQFFEKMSKFAISKRNHHEDFLFVELFGCKLEMCISDVSDCCLLYQSLISVIDFRYAPALKIDLAITVGYETIDPTTVFMSPEFFKNLICKREYFLFYNNNLGNVNDSTRKAHKNGNLTVYSACISKLNCYSTVEDIVADVKHMGFKPNISFSLLKTKILGYNLMGNDKQSGKKTSRLTSIVENLEGAGARSFTYRIESRISPLILEDTVIATVKSVQSTTINAYKSIPFFKVVGCSARNLLAAMNYGETKLTAEDIFNIMIYEYLLVEGFLKGSKNLQLLPVEYHRKVKTFFSNRECVEQLIVDTTLLENLVDRASKMVSLKKLIAYVPVMPLNLISFYEALLMPDQCDLAEMASRIVNQYILDITIRKRVIVESLKGINILKSEKRTSANSHVTKKVLMDTALVHAFGGDHSAKWNRLPFRCLIASYLLSSEISLEDIISAIKNFFLRNNMDLIFNLSTDVERLKFRSTTFAILNNCTGNMINLSLHDKSAFANNKRVDLAALKVKLNFPYDKKCKRIAWSEDEEIRLVAISLKYRRHDIWTRCANSAIYGFICTRTVLQMKVKFNGITNRSDFEQLKAKATNWSPLNSTVEHMLSQLQLFHSSPLTNESKEIYRRIYNYDLELFKGGDELEEDIESESKDSVQRQPTTNLEFEFLKEKIRNMEHQILDILAVNRNLTAKVSNLETSVSELTKLISTKPNEHNICADFDNDFDCGSNNGIQEFYAHSTENNFSDMQLSGVTFNMNLSLEEIYDRLKLSYGSGKFTESMSRHQVFKIRKRPSLEQWSEYIKNLHKKNLITDTGKRNAKNNIFYTINTNYHLKIKLPFKRNLKLRLPFDNKFI